MADYTAQRISELQDATKITDRDLFVINEFSTETGYTLTKKVTAEKLANFIRLRTLDDTLDTMGLKELAHYDLSDLLNAFMQGHPTETPGLSSLALSTLHDLKLGELAHLNKDEIGLDDYVKKHDATASYVAGIRQYMTGISQTNGVITGATFANLDDKVKVDQELTTTSTNAVANSAVTAELNNKVNKADATIEHKSTNGFYIAGINQKDGKIISVEKKALTYQEVDSKLDNNSTNPVQNRVIASKISELESSIGISSDSKYVKKSDATASYTAGNNQYMHSIQQVNGRISNVTYKALPTMTVDTALNATSTNPVQNKVITAALNKISSNSASTNSDIINMLDVIYPIGSIYLTTTTTCPLQTLGIGTWQLVGSGRCLWGGNGTGAGLNLEAGLPNITGNIPTGDSDVPKQYQDEYTRHISGAFEYVGTVYGGGASENSAHGATYCNHYNVKLNASRSSSIYGKSTTVQPPAYTVNIFRRISGVVETSKKNTYTDTIGNLMKIYDTEWNYNCGLGDIGIQFVKAVKGSFADASNNGIGASDFRIGIDNPGVTFITPKASGWGYSSWTTYEGIYCNRCYKSRQEAEAALKAKVVTLIF